MSIIGPDLSVILGIAGEPGSIIVPPYTAPGSSYPFVSYGRGAFVNADVIVAPSVDRGASLVFWNRQIGSVEPATVDIREAGTVVGGGGRWLASGPYPDGSRRAYVFGSIADVLDAGPPLSIADDGTIAYKTVYQSDHGVTVITPTGKMLTVPDGSGVELQALPGGCAIWNGGAIGRAPVVPFFADAQNRRFAVTADGAEYLLYWSNTRAALILEYLGSGEGYILETTGFAFSADLRASGNDLYIAWSMTPEERPTDLTLLVVNRTSVRILTDVIPNRLIPTWQALAVPIIFSFTHPVLVAPFKDPTGATAATVEIIVDQTKQTANRPYIVAEDSLAGPFVGTRLGIYTEVVDPSNAIVIAEGSRTRVFACHDGPGPFPLTTLAKLRPFDVPMLELYLVAKETPDQRWDRWQSNLGDLLNDWPGDIGVTLMFYCGGGAPPNEAFAVGDVLESLDAAGLLVNSSSRVKVLGCFEYQRANGIIDHLKLAAAFTSLLLAQTTAGIATLSPVEDDVVRPGITVNKYSPVLTAGQDWTVDFSLSKDIPGAETKVTVRIDTHGNLWITSSNAAGHDATGVTRHVEVR